MSFSPKCQRAFRTPFRSVKFFNGIVRQQLVLVDLHVAAFEIQRFILVPFVLITCTVLGNQR